MKADIVTIFPDFFRGPLDYGITRRAQEMGLAKIDVHDLREFAHDRHRTVDDRPFGGGEGVDERVADFLADRELSIGDYILSGGEMAAAVIIEAVMRLLPGAVGNAASTQQESFTVDAKIKEVGGADSTCGSNGLLDYPHYTRPTEFRGIKAPEALMSGNHEEIRRWRRQRALEKTLRNRPDLLEGAELSEEDRKFLAGIKRTAIERNHA